jgi:hypothetical protein
VTANVSRTACDEDASSSSCRTSSSTETTAAIAITTYTVLLLLLPLLAESLQIDASPAALIITVAVTVDVADANDIAAARS